MSRTLARGRRCYMHEFSAPGVPRLAALPYVATPGQKFAAASFAVVVYMPGLTWLDAPLTEVDQLTASYTVVHAYGEVVAQLARSTTCTLPALSTIDRPNVAATAGRPPLLTGSEPRANTANAAGASDKH